MQGKPLNYQVRLGHRPTELEQLWGIQPTGIRKFVIDTKFRDGPRVFTYHNLFIVTEGNLFLTGSNDAPYNISKGDIFCLFQNKVQAYEFIPNGKQLQMMRIQILGNRATELLRQIGLTPDKPLLKGLNLNRLSPAIARIEELLMSFRNGFENYLQYMIAFMKLIDEIMRQTNRPGRVAKNTTAWLNESIDFMGNEFASGLGVNDVAAHVELQRTYFTKAFTEKIGMSPSEYLRKLRMDKAHALLCETDCPISDIARLVGYGEPVSFTRAFRQYYGNAPSLIRFRSRKA